MLWLVILIISILPVYVIFDWLIRSFKICDYEHKFIVITGCDTGFGNALAKKLDAMGFNVMAGCLTKDGEMDLTCHASGKLRTFHIDVSSQESVQKALRFVKENLPKKQGLWALVNNAGIAGQTGPPDLNTVEGYKKTLDVNLLGHIDMCHSFLPLIKQSRGRIVTMTSVAGRIAGAEGPYCASKFGLEGYIDVLRRELYWQGIKVCILEPGFYKTDILNVDELTKGVYERLENADDDIKSTYGEKFAKRFTRRVNKASQLAETNLEPVINAYVHAITSKFPRSRYVIGLQARFIFIPASYLPDCILNRAISSTANYLK